MSNQPTFSIYYLIDPIDNNVRYVGYSKYPARRYRGHLRDSFDSRKVDWDSYKCCWIRLLAEANLKPILRIVCILETHQEAQRVEVALIACLRQRGVRLTNGTVGGDGGSQGEAARLKMRLAKLGTKQNPEHVDDRRNLHRIGALRRFENPEQIRKQSDITRNQWANPVGRAKRLAGIHAYHAKSWAEKVKIAEERALKLENALALAKRDGLEI